MKALSLFFTVTILVIFAKSANAAVGQCPQIVQQLTIDAPPIGAGFSKEGRLQLEHKLVSGVEEYSQNEIEWIQSELRGVLKRIENGTEKEYTYPQRGQKSDARIHDVLPILFRATLESVSRSDVDRLVAVWLLNRLTRPSRAVLDQISKATSHEELESILVQKAHLKRKPVMNGDAYFFQYEAYSPRIILGGSEIVDRELKTKIISHLIRGRSLVTSSAEPYWLATSLNTNELVDRAEELGWKISYDARLGVSTLLPPEGSAKLIFRAFVVGENIEFLTENEQDQILSAIFYGKQFETQDASLRLRMRGKLTEDELIQLRNTRYQPNISFKLSMWGWKVYSQNGFVIFENPVNRTRVKDIDRNQERYPPAVFTWVIDALAAQRNYVTDDAQKADR